MSESVYWVEYQHYNGEYEEVYVRAETKSRVKIMVEDTDQFPTDHVNWVENVENQGYKEVTDYGVIVRRIEGGLPKRFPIIELGDLA